VSRRNRERREQNHQRRLAGDTAADARVREVKADDLLAAFVRVHGRDKLAAQLGAASTSDEDLALAYADDTARAYAGRDVDRKTLIRATYRSALATLQAAPQ
jgi:hypothetical protein